MYATFDREEGEAELYWLASQQYCLQLGKRDMDAVFKANNIPTATGLGVASKYRWDERAKEFDRHRARVNHKGKVTQHSLLSRNTSQLAELVSVHLSKYKDWLEANNELIEESLDAQIKGVRMLAQLSKMNLETMGAFVQQEDLDLALEALAKEIE